MFTICATSMAVMSHLSCELGWVCTCFFTLRTPCSDFNFLHIVPHVLAPFRCCVPLDALGVPSCLLMLLQFFVCLFHHELCSLVLRRVSPGKHSVAHLVSRCITASAPPSVGIIFAFTHLFGALLPPRFCTESVRMITNDVFSTISGTCS